MFEQSEFVQGEMLLSLIIWLRYNEVKLFYIMWTTTLHQKLYKYVNT